MRSLDRVQVRAGIGLEGDRYALGMGHYSENHRVSRDITLVEAEVLDDLHCDHGVALPPGGTRRNLTTRGIRLPELIGRQFLIGDVVCQAPGCANRASTSRIWRARRSCARSPIGPDCGPTCSPTVRCG
jgi:MOSC domain-containing protein YiiM